jgi:hypothetical protein
MGVVTTDVTGETISDAWLAAVRQLLDHGRHGYHTTVRIKDPTAELDEVRTAVKGLLEGFPDIETVANTIFPAKLAASCEDYTELRERYLAILARIGKWTPNKYGTYFGRLIDLHGDGQVDQLGTIMRRLDAVAAGAKKKKTDYETTVVSGGAAEQYERPLAEHCTINRMDLPGGRPQQVPCMSSCAFQLDEDTVHLPAQYRNLFMIEKAYGNYLGLGRLLEYVASTTGFKTGSLTVVAGHAELDLTSRTIRERLSDVL